MDGYRTEKEQIELLSDLWKKYGVPLISGIVIALIISFAWHQWQGYQLKQRLQAALTYEQFTNLQDNPSKEASRTQGLYAKRILSDYGKTSYAQLTRLLLARNAVDHKNYVQAIKQLQAVINTPKVDKHVKAIAQLRLARIYVQQQQTAKSLAVLKQENNPAFKAQHQIVLGQTYVAAGKKSLARKAFKQALKLLPDGAPGGNMVKWQMDDLA